MTQLLYKLTRRTANDVKYYVEQLLEHGVYFNPDVDDPDKITLHIALDREDFEASQIDIANVIEPIV